MISCTRNKIFLNLTRNQELLGYVLVQPGPQGLSEHSGLLRDVEDKQVIALLRIQSNLTSSKLNYEKT